MKTLTMRRKGEFTVSTFGANPCGTEPHQVVKYRLTCVCTTKLDARGFLFDQMAVQQFFDEIAETDMSCEELVEEAVKGIVSRVDEENPTCLVKKIRLTLSPAPHVSSMTYAIRGDDLRELKDSDYEPSFMKDEDADPRTESNAPSLAKKAPEPPPPPPPVYGIYHTFRNEWMRANGGEGDVLAFPSYESAEEERVAEFGRRCEVRVIPREQAPQATKSGLAPAPTAEAKRWGIWNSKTSSWMHAKGWDRVFNTSYDAKSKISQKVNSYNGSNWIHCEPKAYDGERDRDNPKPYVKPLPSRELGTDSNDEPHGGCGRDYN